MLIQNDIDENIYEIEDLTNKRQDVQNEYRDKLKSLKKFRDENEHIKKKLNVQQVKMEQSQQLRIEIINYGISLDKPLYDVSGMELTIEQKFSMLEEITYTMMGNKVASMMEISKGNLTSLIDNKYKNIIEKPYSILKRLEGYNNNRNDDLMRGKMYCNTILVKVFRDYLEERDDDSEDNMNKEDSDHDDGKSFVSKSKAGQSATTKKSKEDKKKEKEEAEKKAHKEEINNNPDSIKYQFCMETFNISAVTDYKTFHKKIIEHFALEPENQFFLHDDNGEKIEEDDIGINGSRKIEKVMETVLARELKDKELHPSGPRRAILYIGNDKFEEKYKYLMDLKRTRLEEEKQNQKAKMGLKDADLENEEKKVAEMKTDKEEIFLRQFPDMSTNYRNVKQLMIKHKGNPNFSITRGSWIPPTFCTIFVNLIQFFLTFKSIMIYKDTTSFYWHPEDVREDLVKQFMSIQDENGFWNFTENDLGGYLFREEKLLSEGGGVDSNSRINQWDKTTLARVSKGKIFVGPLRFLQKRVASKDCKRASSVTRYKEYSKTCYHNSYDEDIQAKNNIDTTND